jgi:hypothetical protein
LAEPGLIEPAGAAARAGFLAELRRTFDLAAERAGGHDPHDFLIAGRRIRILLAGDALAAPLAEALAHARAASPGEPDLTVRAWDSASTATRMASPQWTNADYRKHGIVRNWFDEDLQVIYEWGTGALTVLRPWEGEGMFWVPDAAGFPYYARAAPLQKLLHLWFASEGLQVAHSAAVSGEDGCVLLPGSSGAGKSSATLACLSSGLLGHIADDYCVLEAEGSGEVAVHSLYSSAKADAAAMERLGLDAAMIANPVRPADEKAIFFLGEHAPDQLVPRSRLRAIAMPIVTGHPDSSLVPVGRGAALAALGPSTMLQLPGTGAATMSQLASIARSVPAFQLEAGTDPGQVAPLLAELLRQ